MGLADRDYYGRAPQSGPPTRPAGPLASAPVTKALLIANIAIFVIELMFFRRNPMSFDPMLEYGVFTVNTALLHGEIWRFIMFQFLHGSVGHILFNSIGLYFFGPFMERWWGNSWRFLVFYLVCGVAGGVFFTLLMLGGIVPGDINSGLIGASAGIYGLLIGTAMIAPAARVQLLFPPVELSMRTFALGLMGIAVFMILTNLHNAGGEAGHLGGAIAAFFLMKSPDLIRMIGGHRRGKVDIIPPKAFRKGAAKPRAGSKVVAKSDPEIDRILDKISRHGLGSLSDAERRKLREAAGEPK